MTQIDLIEMTVARAQAGFASGAFTSEQLTRAFLDRIDAVDPHYNAIIFRNDDAALATSRAIDERRASGEKLGPLAGVPVVVKDTMDMVGFPTTGGWSLLYSGKGGVDLLPVMDATVVARLRAAGAVILGKTNVPILSASGTHASNSWAGPTYNAAGRGFMPGGSTAGTATAVASSMAVLGLAEETGGSIQNPAAAQGLVGVKPTFALVPNVGVMPLSSLRDVVGPIARTVRDAALLLDVLAGFTMEDPKTVAAIGRVPQGGYEAALDATALRGKRLGLYGPGWRDQPLAPEIAAEYARTQGELRARGAVLVEDPFAGSGFAEIGRPFQGPCLFDRRGLESVPYDLQKFLERHGPTAQVHDFASFAAATAAEDPFAPGGILAQLGEDPLLSACRANPSQPPDMSAFAAVRAAYLSIFASVIAQHQLDALVFPQMRTPLPEFGGTDTIQETTVSEINVAGLPGVTLPAGYLASGAPFNLIFVGAMWSEAGLLAMAHDYEYATQHRRAPVIETSTNR